MPAVRNAANRLLYEGKTILARSPTLALPVARLRGHGEPFDPHVDIVIEGFPRSANSFAVHAFRVAQDRPVRIAHKSLRSCGKPLSLPAPVDNKLRILRHRAIRRRHPGSFVSFGCYDDHN